MNLTKSAQEALRRLIESGVGRSADKLAVMSHTRWSMQTVSVNTAAGDHLRSSTGNDAQGYYGAYFNMPGGVFLVLFSQRSGKVIIDAFLSDSPSGMKAIPNLEQSVLAEISNVLVNAVAAEFADACDMGFFVSAPEMLQGSKERLFELTLKKFSGTDKNLAVTSYVHMSSPSVSTDCSLLILLTEAMAGRLVEAIDA